ncbi:MAG: membrane protein insertase YidC, partial [Terriglobia bacterium]
MAELGPEKRILLAFALSFLVLVVWSRYLQKKSPPAPVPVTPAPTAMVEEPAPTPPSEVEAPAERLRPGRAPTGQKIGREAREIVVESDVARIVFSTQGAVVKSWTLKDYKNAPGDDSEPLDLVHPDASAELGYPLSFALADPEREQALNQALFVASREEAELRAPVELTFEYNDGQVAAAKRFRVLDAYVIELETELFEEGRRVEHGIAWRGGFGDASLDTSWADLQVVWRAPDGVERKRAQSIGEGENETFAGPFAYAGLEDRYFAAVFLPDKPAASGSQLRLAARRLSWTPEGAAKPQPVVHLSVAWPAGSPTRLFVGPKAFDVLKQVQPAGSLRALDEMVDFWWGFAFIAKPIFLGMRWLHDHWIPSYGWAIVLLTLVINMGLFPLKWKSMQSAWKMQKIAPQMRAIQEKYKKYRFNDPRKQQMQQELMGLYRQHGVNPLGGCLPMLLQIPFFYAFYMVLSKAIELRHAPWLWIPDLSVRDPYYILPVVMTLSMYISTKMTPMTTTDPTQQKMMSLMPLFFGFLFLTFSAGLVLYWMVSN